MMDIDAVIAEAVQSESAPVQDTTVATSEEAQVTEAPEETTQETDDVSKKPDSELTPEQLAKREANRQSHLNRKLAKQRLREENRLEKAKNAELTARLEKLEQQLQPKQQAKPDGKPDITQFEDHMEYLEALADWKLETKLNAAREQTAPKVDTAKVQRLQEMATHEAEFAKSVPDYERLVYQENAYIMNNMPKHVAEALLDADDASLALYTLAKEGKLEDLEDLDGKALDKAIAKAEERGKAYLTPAKKATSATPPLESVKGTGRAAKDPSEMSVDELMKHYNQR